MRWRACWPRGSSVVQATCVVVVFGFLVSIMFARSIGAIVQGVLGICVSVETFLQVGRGAVPILGWYSAYMAVSTLVSLGIGANALFGADATCASAANASTCTNTQLVYGLVTVLGALSIGLFASINAGVTFLAVRRAGGGRRGAPAAVDRKVAL